MAMYVPWAVLASLMAAAYLYYRHDSSRKAIGGALMTYGAFGLGGTFLAGAIQTSDLGLGMDLPTEWVWGLVFFVFFAAVFWAGWKMYRPRE